MNSLRQIGPASRSAFEQVKASVQQATQPLKDFTETLGKIQGASINKIAQATGLNELTSAGNQARQTLVSVAEQTKLLAQDVVKSGQAHKTASGDATEHSSSLGLVAKSMGIVLGAATALGTGMFLASKKAAESIKGIADAAEQFGGQDLDKYQQARYILIQMGMNADEADRAIQHFTESGQKNIAKLADELKKMGWRFPDTAEGMAGLREQIERLGGANVYLDPVIKKLKSLGIVVAPNVDLGKFANDITKLSNMTDVFKKLKDETPDVIKAIKSTADMVAALGDESEREKVVIAMFGDEAGKKLVDKMEEGSAGVDDLLLDFQRLGKWVSDDMVDAARDYSAATGRMSMATQNMRNEVGARFMPIFTQGIIGFTNILVDSRSKMDAWAVSVRDTLKRIGTDLGSIMRGGDALNFNWLNIARDAFVDFGQGIAQVFKNIVVPAFGMLEKLAPVVGTAIKDIFGDEVKASAVAIVAVISYMIAGFKGMAAAAGIFFGLFGKQTAKKDFEVIAVGYKEVADGAKTASTAVTDISNAFGKVWKAASDFFLAIKNAFTTTGGLGATVLTGVLDTIARSISSLTYLIQKAEPAIRKFFSNEGIWPTVRLTVLSSLFLSMTGIFDRFLSGLTLLQVGLWTISGTFSVITGAASILGLAFSGIAFVLTPLGASLVIAAAGFALLVRHFNDIVKVCDVVAAALNGMFGTDFFTGMGIATAGLIVLAGILGGVFVASCLKAAAAVATLGIGLNLLESTSVVLRFAAIALAILGMTGALEKSFKSIGEATKKWADYRDEIAKTEQKSKETDQTISQMGTGATGQGFLGMLQQAIQSLGLTKDQADLVNKEISKLFGGLGQLGQRKAEVPPDLKDLQKALWDTGKEADNLREKFQKIGIAIVPPAAAEGGKDLLTQLQDDIKKTQAEYEKLLEKKDFYRPAPVKPEAVEAPKQLADNLEQAGQKAEEAKQKIEAIGTATPKAMDNATKGVKDVQDAIEKQGTFGFGDLFNFLKRPAGDMFAQVWEGMKTSIKAGGDNTKKDLNDLGDWIAKFFSGLGKLGTMQAMAGEGGGLIPLPKPRPAGANGGEGIAGGTQAFLQPFLELKTQVQEIWNGIVDYITDMSNFDMSGLVTELTSPFQEAEEAIVNTFQSIASEAETMSQRIVTAANAAAQALRDLAAAQGGGGGGEAYEFASGGLMRGRPGVDTNLGWFSDFEYVMRPEAVRFWGVRFMNFINKLRWPLPRYAAGGLNITSPSSDSAMAYRALTAGSTTSAGTMRTLRLVLGTHEFDATAPANVVSSLEREIAIRRMAATGTAQSFIR